MPRALFQSVWGPVRPKLLPLLELRPLSRWPQIRVRIDLRTPHLFHKRRLQPADFLRVIFRDLLPLPQIPPLSNCRLPILDFLRQILQYRIKPVTLRLPRDSRIPLPVHFLLQSCVLSPLLPFQTLCLLALFLALRFLLVSMLQGLYLHLLLF